MIEILCNNIYKSFLSGNKANNRELFDKVFEISRYFFQNPFTLESLENLFELEKKLMNSKGPHKQFIEENILQSLSRSTLYCAPEQHDNEYLTLNAELIERATDDDAQHTTNMASTGRNWPSISVGGCQIENDVNHLNNESVMRCTA